MWGLKLLGFTLSSILLDKVEKEAKSVLLFAYTLILQN
jgi:hypothetical protein